VQRDIGLTTYSFSVMPSMVVGTELIATVHSRLACRLQGVLPIETRAVPLVMNDFHQTMQWHKYRSRDPGLIWLRDLLREAAAGMGAVPSVD
jgi:DNA-binding transcriptional LysR family regulator